MGAVIDLGLDRSPPPTVRPRWHALRQLARLGRRFSRWRRPLMAALVAVVALALFAPAPPSLPSPLVLVAQREAPQEEFWILGDLLYIQESSPASGAAPVLSAHRLPSGDYLWTTKGQPWRQIGQDGPIWTAILHRPDGPRWTARDPATGAELWSITAPVIASPGTDVGLLGGGQQTGLISGPFRVFRHERIDIVDLTTGENRWSARSDAGWQAAVGPAGVVVLVDGTGEVQVRELDTGELRVSASRPELGLGLLVGVHEDVVVFVVFGGPSVAARAYDLDTLTLRWNAVVEAHRFDPQELYFGASLLRWHNEAETGLLDFRGGRVSTIPEPRTGRVLLVGDLIVLHDGDGNLPREVVDRRDSRVLADLAGWRLVDPTGEQPARLVLTRDSPGGTVLASLDAATGDLTYLGTEPRRLTDCRSFDGGLVCHGAGSLSVWRWR